MSKIPSPCIDVCKYKLKGHCIACSMTKAQKSAFKRMDGQKDKRAFLDMLVAQQQALGNRFKGWGIAYRRKCAKKDLSWPLKQKGT
ncbi:MAG: DUF1289 domain-containing protein [Pseudomonadota bacterium]